MMVFLYGLPACKFPQNFDIVLLILNCMHDEEIR